MGNGFRYWSWTLFYTSDLESKERIIQEFAKSFTLYTVYGKEVCPKTNKTHLQGYFVFKNQHELRWIKRRTFNDIHAEPSSVVFVTRDWSPCNIFNGLTCLTYLVRGEPSSPPTPPLNKNRCSLRSLSIFRL